MDDQIISREGMFKRGERAFVRGHARDSHHMNQQSLALPDWLAGYDQAATTARQLSQSELMAGRRVDRTQIQGA